MFQTEQQTSQCSSHTQHTSNKIKLQFNTIQPGYRPSGKPHW